MINLKNKNALITGATGGIGREIVEELAKEGCNLFLTSTNKIKLRRLKKRLEKKYNIKIKFSSANFKNDFHITQLCHNVIWKLGETIDILINCAGIYKGDYDTIFNVNVKAPYLLVKEFSKDMIKRKWGRIVNIGSISSYEGFPDTELYCASKHALLGLSRSWRGKFKDYNVRVYCISPSAVKTNMGKEIPNQNYKTFLNPKEIAEYIVFIMKFDKELITEELRLNRFQV